MKNIDKTKRHLLFFDLDRTLLFDGVIPLPVEEALLAAQEKGHAIILNTGRSKAFVPEIAMRIPWDGLVCGTSYVEYHGEILFNHPVPTDLLMIVAEYCIERNIPIRLEGISEVFSTSPRDTVFRNIQGDYRELLPTVHDISKVTVHRPVTDEENAFLSRYFDTVRLPTYTEALQRGITKATGIEVVARHEGIPLERTVAFGDSLNDLGMLRCAGIGCVMVDAPPELMALADFVATEETTGVAELLRLHFL